MNKTAINEAKLKEAIGVLDGLLGVQVRKPGAAAKLPAVIRVIESLEPAGGMHFPVFPASYAGDGQNAPPVYDLNGIEYGPELRVIRGKDRDRHERQIIRARHCTIDSPQSQANRTEVAFVEDPELRKLVPQAMAKIPRSQGKRDAESIFRLPHRIADFRVRLSDKGEDVKAAIGDFANGDALKLLKLMPTSIVFGFWDSRGDETQHKHARLLLSRIDAFDVVPCTKNAIYSGPYSKDEFAQVVLNSNELAVAGQDESERESTDAKSAAAKKAFDTMAVRGFTAALSGGGLGGVLVEGKIERLSLISLTDIARLSCADKDDKEAGKLTNAARRYIFALAALAEAHPRGTGSHRLRSGCELITVQKTVELRGAVAGYDDAQKLRDLFDNRAMLIAVAAEAQESLKIPEDHHEFVVTAESLKADFQVGASKGKPNTAVKKATKKGKTRN